MRTLSLIALSLSLAALITRAADWPSQSGNAQRDGWAKSEKAFTKENAKNIELLYKYATDNQTKSLMSLTTPIVNGNLITYLGFKEMLVFGGSQDKVYSVDADLNRKIWEAHFEYRGNKPAAAPTALCPGGMTATLAMPGSSTAAGRGGAPPPGRGPVVAGVGTPPPVPAVPAVPAPAAVPAPGRGPAAAGGLFNNGFGRAGIFLAVSSDGFLHPLNTSTGADKVPAVRFVPANSKVTSLNLNDGVIYAVTQDRCGGSPNALYALDMSGTDHKLSSFETNGSGAAGSGGTAIASNGTVYAQIPDGHGDVAGNYSDTVIAFSKDLKVKDYFTPADAAPAPMKGASVPGITPVVFAWKGKEVVVAAGRNGRVYMLDAASLGGANHHTPLAVTEPLASPDLKYAGNGFTGTFSSWETTDDAGNTTRWIYAPLQGPAKTGSSANGSIVALRIEEHDGQPALIPAWVSRDMMTPAPPVTANGLVFALSRGESAREAKENGKPYSIAEREKMATHATLFVLDGTTGAELYSSGNMATSFAHDTGLAVANRRIYFTTHDNTLLALGFMVDQPQLTGR